MKLLNYKSVRRMFEVTTHMRLRLSFYRVHLIERPCRSSIFHHLVLLSDERSAVTVATPDSHRNGAGSNFSLTKNFRLDSVFYFFFSLSPQTDDGGAPLNRQMSVCLSPSLLHPSGFLFAFILTFLTRSR